MIKIEKKNFIYKKMWRYVQNKYSGSFLNNYRSSICENQYSKESCMIYEFNSISLTYYTEYIWISGDEYGHTIFGKEDKECKNCTLGCVLLLFNNHIIKKLK